MATITLADRISVRVTAKDSTETSNQNKTNGGNVAEALGGTGLTDSEKEELGESLGETVTDESGKTYARSNKVAGVLKQIAAAGKLSEPTEVHEGINGYNLSNVIIGPTDYIVERDLSGDGSYLSKAVMTWHIPENTYLFVFHDEDSIYEDKVNTFLFSKTKPSYFGRTYAYVDNGVISSQGEDDYTSSFYAGSQPLNGTNYSFFFNNIISSRGKQSGAEERLINYPEYTEIDQQYHNDITKHIVGYLYGSTSTSGGAKLDPTGKSDAQIQKDLEDSAALNNCKMTSDSGDTYIAVTDANGNPLYFLGA